MTAPGRTLQREPSAHSEPTYHSAASPWPVCASPASSGPAPPLAPPFHLSSAPPLLWPRLPSPTPPPPHWLFGPDYTRWVSPGGGICWCPSGLGKPRPPPAPQLGRTRPPAPRRPLCLSFHTFWTAVSALRHVLALGLFPVHGLLSQTTAVLGRVTATPGGL